MKIILAIIAASCIVDCTSSQLSSALSCYQSCQDEAWRYTDPVVAEYMELFPEFVEDHPNCDASDMFACDGDSFVCAAVELSMEGTMFGESVATETFMRECVAPGTSEETYCSEVKSAMTSTSDDVIDFKSCELYLCYTDNCNTFGMKGETIVDPDGNGIHLTVLSKREIARCLATCVRELMGRSYLIRKHWPLRREYVSLLGRP